MTFDTADPTASVRGSDAQPSLTDLRDEVQNFVGERGRLLEGIVRDFRRGVPAKTIASVVAVAFSRDQVVQYLAAVALHDDARKVLKAAGLAGVTSVSFTGIATPREALITLGADPVEIADVQAVPGRVREALRAAVITLDVPQGEHDEVTDELVDELFLDGEPIRLVRMKSRV